MNKDIFKTFDEVEGACGILVNTFPSIREADFIVGVSRGGLIPAVLISTLLNKPLVAAYINKKDEVFFDRADWIKGKKVIVVDDIMRTGKTMNKIMDLIKTFEPLEIDCAVLGVREECWSNPLSHWHMEENENIIFPWDFDFK